ncbi:MAG: hypothetical protein HC848_04860 [Limnobacter sp.]|nr:hypothetical protein [Limnobacter sp.]
MLDLIRFGSDYRPLILLLIVAISAVIATLRQQHLSLREPRTKIDYQVGAMAMLGGNLLMLISTLYYLKLQYDSGLDIDRPLLGLVTIVLFAVVVALSLRDLLKGRPNAQEGGSYTQAMLCVPLYAVMALVVGHRFFSNRLRRRIGYLFWPDYRVFFYFHQSGVAVVGWYAVSANRACQQTAGCVQALESVARNAGLACAVAGGCGHSI